MDRSKRDVQKQFSQSATKYVSSKIHAKGEDLDQLVQLANLQGEEFVLDIATGGGHVANALAPFSKKVVAFDITSEILQAAEAFIVSNGMTNVEFVQGDAEALPFPDEAFNVVTCRIAAHHFPNPSSFVKEAFRTLKRGGQFLLIDNVVPEKQEYDQFYNTVEKERDYSHYRAWKKSEWIKMIEEAGLEMEVIYCFPKTFLFDEWFETMNKSEEEKAKLTQYIASASEDIKAKFIVKERENQIYSFNGNAILLKAVKRK